MSVMLERQIVPPCPCTPDCPDRGATCMLHCSYGYAEYRAARDAAYAERAKANEATRDANAGRRRAGAKKAREQHRHPRK